MGIGIDVGKFGENQASRFLLGKGYRIIDRNYRKPWGELDIIAMAPNGTIVFVEVKTLTIGNSLEPEDHLTKAKLEKLQRTCRKYVAEKPRLIREDRGWRIDLVALTISDKSCNIRHYENI